MKQGDHLCWWWLSFRGIRWHNVLCSRLITLGNFFLCTWIWSSRREINAYTYWPSPGILLLWLPLGFVHLRGKEEEGCEGWVWRNFRQGGGNAAKPSSRDRTEGWTLPVERLTIWTPSPLIDWKFWLVLFSSLDLVDLFVVLFLTCKCYLRWRNWCVFE